jgi:signal transduction histidine kinase
MKLELQFFRTRVATRVFTLFIICAIVPIAGFALLSFSLVKRQLNEQCLKRLHQENKAMAVSIFERLFLFRAEMRMVASSLNSYPENSMQNPGETLTNELRERLVGLTLMTDKGCTALFPLAHIKNPPDLSVAEKRHLKSGKAVLHEQLIPNSWPRLFIGVLLDPDHPNRGVLLGEISRAYLWEVADRRPPMAELFVIDRQNNTLFSSLSSAVSFPAQSLRKMNLQHSGQFEWIHETKKYFVDYTSLFLEPNFLFPNWIVVLSESYDEALLPVESFKRWFPAVIILSLAVVFFLSVRLIRKNMGPIETLHQATRKIADGAFGHNVEIESGDEFESLGRSFNEMSKKLKEGQALLVQAAKLSGIGQMAAGVIHEVKQPLTAIHGLIQLSMLDQIPDKSKERLETAIEAVERLDSILLRFSAFSRPHEETIENLSITKIISQVHQLLEHQLMMKNIHYHIEAEEDLPQIRGDSQGLEQVFSNLLINAIHALEDKGNDQRLVSIKAYSSEDKVLVEIEDNGCGIPEEIQERIFDPFFTTKGADKGTGLGMAIVASILHKHRAGIGFESKVGVGTKFTIAFPAFPKAED